jgi:hypothetical protein
MIICIPALAWPIHILPCSRHIPKNSCPQKADWRKNLVSECVRFVKKPNYKNIANIVKPARSLERQSPKSADGVPIVK